MKNLVYSKKADGDLEKIFEYTYLKFGGKQALKYSSALHASGNILTKFPEIGRKYHGTKRKNLRRYNSGRHILFYTIKKDEIFIVRILHDRMNFDDYL